MTTAFDTRYGATDSGAPFDAHNEQRARSLREERRRDMSGHDHPEVVVVTGAGAGLGRAIVQSFAKRGAHIGLISRGTERLDDAVREVADLGGQAIALPADVADAQALEDAASRVEAEFGPIDIWVNDAMTTVFSPVREMSAADFKRVTEVTYLGFVYGTMAALRRMQPRNHGTIVQVGSALAYRSIPLQSAYCGAKHAMVGFTDSLRSELIHDGSDVRLTVVHMPGMNTPQFRWCKSVMPRTSQPVPPIFQPEIGAEAVYWAAHHDRRELLVGWPTVKAVWGQKFIPGYLDRYLADNTWDGQMTDTPQSADSPANLYEPVSGHQGAHGVFDDRSKEQSSEVWLATRPRWAPVAAIAGVAVAGLSLFAAKKMR
jgi:NAD(P)-dependent dehydrogenase (short-subunit alcohol dehydrogenase family)